VRLNFDRWRKSMPLSNKPISKELEDVSTTAVHDALLAGPSIA